MSMATLALTALMALPAWSADVRAAKYHSGRVMLAADPVHPERLATSGMVVGDCPSRMAVHLSTNAGWAWEKQCVPVPDIGPASGAPAVAYDASGDLLTAALVIDGDQGRNLRLTRTTDGGQSWSAWSPIVSTGRDEIENFRLHLDQQERSPFKNALYMSYTLTTQEPYGQQMQVARSTDGGATWSSAGASPHLLGSHNMDFGNLAIGPNGRLYLTYLTCHAFGGCSGEPAKVKLVRSDDGGITWSKPYHVADVQQPLGCCRWGGLPDSRTSLSFDPGVAVDASSGPRRGEVYVVTTTLADGKLQVLLARSEDGGRHWTPAQPVSAAAGDQFMPTIAISPKGVLAVSWFDRREDPENIRYRPVVAFSNDGGRTFGDLKPLDDDLGDPRSHYDLESVSALVWSGRQLEALFYGKGTNQALNLRANSVKP
jgi:hypothetical protein